MPYFTEKVNLIGRVAIVTGGNSGIGYETVKYLVANGAISIMACRDASRAAAARSQILNELSSQSQASDKSKNESQEKPLASNEEVGARLLVRLLDLCSLRSVRAFVEGLEGEGLLKRLDLLILNAGGPGPADRTETEDGLEVTMAMNHFGHFLLTNLLIPHIKRTAEMTFATGSAAPRIVEIASEAHAPVLFLNPKLDIDDTSDDLNFKKKGAYGRWKAYGSSKLAGMLFTLELRKRLAGTGVRVVALHPGRVNTNAMNSIPKIMQFFVRRFLRSSWEGCQTTLYCALSHELEPSSKDAPQPAIYFEECAPSKPHELATDERTACLLWTASERYTGLAK